MGSILVLDGEHSNQPCFRQCPVVDEHEHEQASTTHANLQLNLVGYLGYRALLEEDRRKGQEAKTRKACPLL